MQIVMKDIQLFNAYIKPGSDKYPEIKPRLQVMVETPMEDGSVQNELLNINVPMPVFQHCVAHIGEEMTLCVNPYGKEGGGVGYSYPKYAVPMPTFRKPKEKEA